MPYRRLLPSLLLSLAVCPTALLPLAGARAQAAAPAPQAGKPAIGAWGVDLTGRDLAVRPGDDFDRYASGTWYDAQTIPADRPSVGTFADLSERVDGEVRDIITAAPPSSQLGGLYLAYMDQAHLDALGLAPLKADLAKLDAITDKRALARLMGDTGGSFGMSIVDYDIGPDPANAHVNVLHLYQGGLGLPNRGYYLSPQFALQHAAYRAYMLRTLTAIGTPNPATATTAVLAFEAAIAKVSWDEAARRDLDKTNSVYSSASLASYAPGLDWDAFFEGAHVLPQARLVVAENSAVQAIAALWAATPLSTLKLWEAFHIADQASPYLTTTMDESRFDYTKTLSGISQQRPRWRRGVDLVNGSLGELLGESFVARYFPPAAKAKMEDLVANLKTAMAGRIQGNGWMSPGTKQAALLKLSRMQVMVGYPDKWRDYSGLHIVPGDLYGNVKRATRFNADYDMADLGKPVDLRKWDMTPQTVNAYNGEQKNQIVFPAAILQPPFFDAHADDAVNYGAIGMVIGHEISHGFDDQGRKIDADGNLHDWWTDEDAKRFEAEAKVFGDEYAKFEVVPGAFINPALTMGENIADFAGIEVAFAAYHQSLGGKPAPVLDGLTGDQRFFLADAQVWRTRVRPEALRNQVATNPHSPGRYRVLGVLPNIDGWYEAWHVTPGQHMYIAPENRARIW